MKLIGLGHRKRVGKDEATRFALSFARTYRPDLRISILSFGDQVKEVSYSMYSWGGLEHGYHYENHPDEIEEMLPAIGKSPRQIWDTVGLMGREICEKTWVELALVGVDSDLLICKDVRGEHEFGLIKKVGGLSVRVNRIAAPRGGPVDDILADAPWDVDLDNNGTLRDLNVAVKDLTKKCIDEWFEPAPIKEHHGRNK